MSRFSLFLLALGAFVLGTELFVIAGILPSIAKDLGVHEAVAGQLVTLFALAYALGAPVFSSLLGRFSRKRVLLVSMGIFALTNLATALVPGYGWLAVLRVASALSACLFLPNASSLVAEKSDPSRRGRNMGLVLGGLGVSTVLGVPIGVLINGVWGWRAVFLMIAGLAAVQTFLLLTLPHRGPGRVTPLKERFRPITKGTTIRVLLTTILVISAGFGCYTYVSLIVKAPSGMGDGLFALLLAAHGVAAALGSWLGGWLTDRWGSRRALQASIGVLFLVFLTMTMAASSIIAAFGLMIVWGLAAYAFTPIQQHRLLESAPEGGPGVIALNSSAIYLGQALAAAWGGQVLWQWGASTVPFVAAGIAVTVLVAALGFRKA